MTSSGHNNHGGLPFYLSPEQQNMLLQALASGEGKPAARQPTSNAAFSVTPLSPEASPEHRNMAYEEPRGGAYLDGYGVDFTDTSFDFDVSALSNPVNDDGAGSGGSDSPENDGPDKRPREDGGEGDTSTPGHEAKRRESTEKVPKKPGRKPLTSEPTSKRKAQNRAAQRAFRERKEKHLKDLETKVVELEKKSIKSHSENSTLRKQLQAVTAELNEYKRKVRLVNAGGGALPRDRPTAGVGGQGGLQNLNNIDFQFEFPRFGYLPGPPPQANGAQNSAKAAGQQQKPSSTSPPNTFPAPNLNGAAGPNSRSAPGTLNGQSANVADVNRSPTSQYEVYSTLPVSRTSMDSGYSLGSATTGSPAGSANSYLGTSSSCGTSPEPYNQSPLGFKPVDTMTTIGEEQTSMPTANNTQVDGFNNIPAEMSFDWLAQQNGGQFDPQLFSDYREPQSNILNIEDSFFSDALDADFFTPYNVPPTGLSPKKDLMSQINDQQDALDPVVVKNEPAIQGQIGCDEVWQKIQNCDSVKAGSFDLDSLCSELQKKAKCSGEGPAIQEQEFDTILKKYLGPEFVKKCGGEIAAHHLEASRKV